MNAELEDLISTLQRQGCAYQVMTKHDSQESQAIQWLERNFPMESWGARIAWRQVTDSICLPWQSWQEMRSALSKLLDHMEAQTDKNGENVPVIVVWFDASMPLLRISIDALRVCGAEILDADFDVWIICPTQGWCIEKYHEGELCYGSTAMRP